MNGESLLRHNMKASTDNNGGAAFTLTRGLTAAVCVAALLLPTVCGCGRKGGDEASAPRGKVVVQVGDSTLYEQDVLSRIPSGITSSDSALLYDAIVQNWIEKRLLIDVAEVNLPAIERIERMVEDYRLQLLTNEYRRVMAESNTGKVSPDSVKSYYVRHREELRLKSPLVKGIYVKMPPRSRHLGEIRGWMLSGDSTDIAQLESYGLQGAMQYDDFRHTWVAWQSLAGLIPYNFGGNTGFLTPGYLFDREIDGAQYLLLVTEVMPEGEIMPFEFARNEVSRILADRLRASYDADLLRSLYRRAISDKTIAPGGYVPRKFRTGNEESD